MTLEKFLKLITNNTFVAGDIIEFIITMNLGDRFKYNFRSWKYAIMKVRFFLNPESEECEVSPDFGCGVTLGDRVYL